METINIDSVKKSFTFYFKHNDKEKYFCKCGGHFEVDAHEDAEFTSEEEELSKAFGITSISMRESLKCPHCDTNYKLPINQKILLPINVNFVSSYKFENKEDECSLYLSEAKAVNNDGELGFEESYRKLTLTKGCKCITYKKTSSEEVDVDLNNVIKVVDDFFDCKTMMTTNGPLELNLFAIELSKHFIDSEKIDIIRGLLDEARGKTNASFMVEAFKKIIVIFFSIIKYSNLSTIVLTKNPLFLYNLLKESNPPSSDVLKEANATSPLKIFNLLANNYIDNVNNEIAQEKINVHELVLKSGDKEIKLDIKISDGYQEGKVVKNEKGEYDVIKFDTDGKVGKFIYNKIRNFHDYKQLIKYTKHLNNNEVVELINKYEYDLIINMIDVIYYRDNMNIDEIKRLIPLFIDHCEQKTKELKRKANLLDEKVEDKIEYKYIANFDFSFYDDCLMMLKTLEFDPAKDFYKIKINKDLKEFHDKVVKYYNAIKMEEDQNYQHVFDKYRGLETRGENDYEGPIEVEILDTPTKVINEGRDMHHSAGSYVQRVMDGKYILLKVIDHSPGLDEKELTRFTMGIFYNEKNGFEFEQVKSYGNKLGSNRFRKILIEWLIAKGVHFDENRRPDIRVI